MHLQIYYNQNSTGEDIIFLKNFCTSLNLQTETLNSNAQTKTQSIHNNLIFKMKNIPNILLIWDINKNTNFDTVKNFCIENFLNFNYLYTIYNGFIETTIQTKINANMTNNNHIQKKHYQTIHELSLNLSKQNTNKTSLKPIWQTDKKRGLLEL